MKTKQFFYTLSGAGLFAVVIFLISSSHLPDEQSRPDQILKMNTKSNQSIQIGSKNPLPVAVSQQEIDSFEIIEEKYGQLNPDQARQEVRRIDTEAHQVSMKNFNDFSAKERLAFLNRQREKAVLLNKLILARLERVQK
jgi:hypothetical protein